MPEFTDARKRWFTFKIVTLPALFCLFLMLFVKFVIFPRAVAEFLRLRQNADGSLPILTYFWANPPSDVLFKFYMWNATNPDEVIYEGALPRVEERGPYVYVAHQTRVNLSWSEDGMEVSYRNLDVWHYSTSLSCASCTEQDRFVMSSVGYTGMASVVARPDTHPLTAHIIDWGTLITGAGAFQNVEVGQILFYSFNDPLIAVKQSPLFESFVKLMGGTILGTVIPEYPKYAGLLANYNNSLEPEFTVRTGAGNIEEISRFVSYGGMRKLHWNAGEELQNCNEGALNKPFLSTDDRLQIFNQYIARTYELEFREKSTYLSIPTYEYGIQEIEFNTNSDKFKSMRYENKEKIDYFPTWPACNPDRVYNPNSTNCVNVDCSREENFCDNCCNGSHFEDTVFTPPGFYVIRVLPGRTDKVPAGIFCSPPHMLWSPNEVGSIYTGQQPDENKHAPVEWSVNPTIGGAVHGIARLQLNLPIWKGPMTQSSALPNGLVPFLWLELEALMHDDIIWVVQLAGLYVPTAINYGIIIPLLVAFISISVITLDKVTRIKKAGMPITPKVNGHDNGAV